MTFTVTSQNNLCWDALIIKTILGAVNRFNAAFNWKQRSLWTTHYSSMTIKAECCIIDTISKNILTVMKAIIASIECGLSCIVTIELVIIYNETERGTIMNT